MVNRRQKPVLFFCPGPEYLFFTTGIFYVWELAQLYNVVLLLDFSFKKLEILERLKEEDIILDYLPLDCPTETVSLISKFKKHRHYCKKSKTLFKKYQPAAIIQHADIAPINIYFFEEARSQKIRRIVYTASLILSDQNSAIGILILLQKAKLAKKRKLPLWLAGYCYEIKRLTGYYINYCLLPFVNKGHFFKPRLNAVCKNGRWYNDSRNYFDHYITHSGKERKAICEITSAPVTVIQLPMTNFDDEVFDFLYGSVAQEDMILILPTSGEIDYIVKTQKTSRDVVAEHYFEKWTQAINIIAAKFPSFKVGIKFKSNEDIDLYKQYLRLSDLDGKIAVIPPEEDTNALILKSRVVVSTNSSVLWWADFLQSERVLISLDLFEQPSGNYYEDVDGVLYFNDIKSLGDFDFSTDRVQYKNTAGITLTEFMQTHV